MQHINFLTIGMILLFVGIAFLILGSFQAMKQGGKAETKVAFGGFIGPFPFGFGNDKQLLYVVMALSAFFLLVWILLQNLR